MRIDVEFDAGGTTLRGWLYKPDTGEVQFPAVVMAHGFSALKEMDLDRYAEAFAAAGLVALVYDNRNLGASDGQPRFEIDPVAQMRDYSHAITYARSRAEIDPGRIGVWGTSYTGGLVIIAAALDRRIKCVVSQVPFISGHETMLQVMPIEARSQFYDMLYRERQSVASGQPPSTAAICTDDPAKSPLAPGRRTFLYFDSHARKKDLNWQNKVTVRSLELRLEYEVGPYINRVSPIPLLMIVADNDTITPTDISLRAFERALQPKKLVIIRGDHYHPYLEAFDQSCEAARDWLTLHLCKSA
jgi:fermentation-respiration switch protein FrsA (DUF1100 family)